MKKNLSRSGYIDSDTLIVLSIIIAVFLFFVLLFISGNIEKRLDHEKEMREIELSHQVITLEQVNNSIVSTLTDFQKSDDPEIKQKLSSKLHKLHELKESLESFAQEEDSED